MKKTEGCCTGCRACKGSGRLQDAEDDPLVADRAFEAISARWDLRRVYHYITANSVLCLLIVIALFLAISILLPFVLYRFIIPLY